MHLHSIIQVGRNAVSPGAGSVGGGEGDSSLEFWRLFIGNEKRKPARGARNLIVNVCVVLAIVCQ